MTHDQLTAANQLARDINTLKARLKDVENGNVGDALEFVTDTSHTQINALVAWDLQVQLEAAQAQLEAM